MARYKTGILLVTTLLLVLPAASFSFDVSIDEITDASVKDVQYSDNVSGVQNINASIENTGSIGCGYRLKADYRVGNDTFEQYSSRHSLWQGATSRAQIMMVTSNYTGMVTGNLTVEYCGQSQEVEQFNYTTQNITLGNSTEVRTTQSNSTSAQIQLTEYTEGKLVPVEAPPYWKTSTSELENSKATLNYEAPIFKDNEEITYAVIQNQTVKATTTVELEEQPTLRQKLMNVNPGVLYTLLIVLGILNVAQILRTRRNKD